MAARVRATALWRGCWQNRGCIAGLGASTHAPKTWPLVKICGRRTRVVAATQLLWQLGEVRRHTAGLIPGEQLRRRAPTGLVLEIEIAERLPGAIADNETGVVRLLYRPRRREAAHGSDDSAISALRRKQRSANLRRRVAMGAWFASEEDRPSGPDPRGCRGRGKTGAAGSGHNTTRRSSNAGPSFSVPVRVIGLHRAGY